MARRGSNSFRRNDGLRALRIAKDGGIEPAMLEIVVTKSGETIFRIYGDKAAAAATTAPTPTTKGAEGWREEIAKLDAKPYPKERK